MLVITDPVEIMVQIPLHCPTHLLEVEAQGQKVALAKEMVLVEVLVGVVYVVVLAALELLVKVLLAGVT
tara:strand:+ start:444 stop:650 length:207 start_codon:yes stop_codon:yes gene_type:complete